MAPVRMAVVGAGHFGALHAEKVARLDGAELVAVVDVDAKRARKVAKKQRSTASDDLDAVLGQVDAIDVVTPIQSHHDVAKAALERGVHVLVEKPVTARVEEARELCELAHARGLVLQVGHLVRFSELSRMLQERVRNPLYIECIRVAPFKLRGTDVNVILDLMIHDVDLILSFMPAEIIDVDAAGADVFSQSEDIANARIKFANGCIASITASRVALKTERKMRVFEPNCYTTVDYATSTLRAYRRGHGTAALGIPNLDIAKHEFGEADLLLREIEAFVESVRTGTPPEVSGEDGLRALEAAIRINESIRAHAAFVAKRTAAEGSAA